MTPLEAWLSRQPTWVLLAYVFLAVPVLWAAALADRWFPRHPAPQEDWK